MYVNDSCDMVGADVTVSGRFLSRLLFTAVRRPGGSERNLLLEHAEPFCYIVRRQCRNGCNREPQTFGSPFDRYTNVSVHENEKRATSEYYPMIGNTGFSNTASQ
jgi:hypothetical protein